MAARTYIATRTGWIAGRFVTKGAKVSLSEEAARHEHVAVPPKARAPRKPRRARKAPE